MESVRQLLKNKGYLLLVLIYLLVYMIGTADQYVVIDKMLDIGADTTAVGIKWALQSFMEVPLFLFSSKILERFQTKTLILWNIYVWCEIPALRLFLSAVDDYSDGSTAAGNAAHHHADKQGAGKGNHSPEAVQQCADVCHGRIYRR